MLESIFLDDALWREVIDHGVNKNIDRSVLSYLQDPHGRAQLCKEIITGKYKIKPPKTYYIPKDDGGERTVFVNEPIDRLLLNIIYKWLTKNEKQMIHASCKSYQQNIGVSRIVKELSGKIAEMSAIDTDAIVGRKFDIHHYFDTVNRECIHKAFDDVESHYGKSFIIKLLRDYYDSDLYYDSRLKKYVNQYQGIKQGCAVSSWLANVILFPLDEALSCLDGVYARYSDDIIFIGPDYELATKSIREKLLGFGLQLNEKKSEDVFSRSFVRFLGFDIRGTEITLSRKWVKNFQKNIDSRTINNKKLIQ